MAIIPAESAQELRRRAEEKCRINEATVSKPLSPEETEQLLHELRVHQVELEMQNEGLRSKQAELDASRARYFNLYDLAPVGYLTFNKNGLILEANLAAANMLRVTRKSLLQNTMSTFVAREDEDIYCQQRKRIFESADSQVWDMRIIRKDGSTFWATLQATPAHNGEYWVTIKDITDRKRAEQELREAKKTAEDANLAKSDFLATVSHEIRTPLGALLGNVELLEQSPLTPYQQVCLNDCKSASRMLLQVINDVLDFSKIEVGKLELVNETFSISSMSRQLARMFSTTAEQKGLELNLSLADDLPEYISGDEQRLRQIISNLLGNAIKFTRQGTVSLEITWERKKNVLRILVSDTGIGIPPDREEQVFERFTQVESFATRTTTGTGLGLPICRSLLALMGGTITVSSVPGEGSIFTVLLPVAVCKAQVELESEVKSEVALDAPPRRILLADDDQMGRSAAQKLLQRKGYNVTAVENGAELLDALQNEEFEIVITDISMPDMSGTQVARIIRSGKRKGIDPDIPIIAMTAHVFFDDREHILAAGINGYVAKPVNLEDLCGQIEDLCNSE